MHRLLVVLIAYGLWVGCGDEVSGPRERIRRFTGCVAPAGTVRVHEQVGGDDSGWTMHAVLVVPTAALPEVVQSCGFDLARLQEGVTEDGIVPNPRPRWWTPVTEESTGSRDGERALWVIPRDTDAMVFVYTAGRD